MKKLANVFVVGIMILLIQGCEPQPDELKLLDSYVVSTYYDNELNFSQFETFAITADTIGLISNLSQDDTIIVGTQYARPVVQQIVSNMTTRGYAQVDLDENPDLVFKVYILKNLNIYQQYNYYGPGYYNPYYYGYYNYYYGPPVSTYAYNTGTLVIDLADFKNRGTGPAKVVWNAQMGDVYSSIDLLGQTEQGIDQAFVQSAYLVNP